MVFYHWNTEVLKGSISRKWLHLNSNWFHSVHLKKSIYINKIAYFELDLCVKIFPSQLSQMLSAVVKNTLSPSDWDGAICPICSINRCWVLSAEEWEQSTKPSAKRQRASTLQRGRWTQQRCPNLLWREFFPFELESNFHASSHSVMSGIWKFSFYTKSPVIITHEWFFCTFNLFLIRFLLWWDCQCFESKPI